MARILSFRERMTPEDSKRETRLLNWGAVDNVALRNMSCAPPAFKDASLAWALLVAFELTGEQKDRNDRNKALKIDNPVFSYRVNSRVRTHLWGVILGSLECIATQHAAGVKAFAEGTPGAVAPPETADAVLSAALPSSGGVSTTPRTISSVVSAVVWTGLDLGWPSATASSVAYTAFVNSAEYQAWKADVRRVLNPTATDTLQQGPAAVGEDRGSAEEPRGGGTTPPRPAGGGDDTTTPRPAGGADDKTPSLLAGSGDATTPPPPADGCGDTTHTPEAGGRDGTTPKSQAPAGNKTGGGGESRSAAATKNAAGQGQGQGAAGGATRNPEQVANGATGAQQDTARGGTLCQDLVGSAEARVWAYADVRDGPAAAERTALVRLTEEALLDQRVDLKGLDPYWTSLLPDTHEAKRVFPLQGWTMIMGELEDAAARAAPRRAAELQPSPAKKKECVEQVRHQERDLLVTQTWTIARATADAQGLFLFGRRRLPTLLTAAVHDLLMWGRTQDESGLWVPSFEPPPRGHTRASTRPAVVSMRTAAGSELLTQLRADSEYVNPRWLGSLDIAAVTLVRRVWEESLEHGVELGKTGGWLRWHKIQKQGAPLYPYFGGRVQDVTFKDSPAGAVLFLRSVGVVLTGSVELELDVVRASHLRLRGSRKPWEVMRRPFKRVVVPAFSAMVYDAFLVRRIAGSQSRVDVCRYEALACAGGGRQNELFETLPPGDTPAPLPAAFPAASADEPRSNAPAVPPAVPPAPEDDGSEDGESGSAKGDDDDGDDSSSQQTFLRPTRRW